MVEMAWACHSWVSIRRAYLVVLVWGATSDGGPLASCPRRCSRPTLSGWMGTFAGDGLCHQLILIISNAIELAN